MTSRSILSNKFGNKFFFSSINLTTWLVSTTPSPPKLLIVLVYFILGPAIFSLATRASRSSLDSTGSLAFSFALGVSSAFFYFSAFSFSFFYWFIILRFNYSFSCSSALANFLNSFCSFNKMEATFLSGRSYLRCFTSTRHNGHSFLPCLL